SSVPYTTLEPSFTLANIGGNNHHNHHHHHHHWNHLSVTAATHRHRHRSTTSASATSGTTTHLSGPISVFDTHALPWYGAGAGGDGPHLTPGPPHPFAAGVQDAKMSTTAHTSGNPGVVVVDKYTFFPTNVI